MKANILLFTKGETTEKIWYYDLSDIKVGKRTPLTESHFDEFFRLLPTQGDSERSWTIDITERKAVAEEKSAPFKQKAAVIEEEIRELKDRLTALKKAKQQDSEIYTELEKTVKEQEKEARELKSQAEAIDNAVYDLKAVNPHVKTEEDNRTPAELLEFIEIKGKEINTILSSLRNKG